jgi:hypothetical protein
MIIDNVPASAAAVKPAFDDGSASGKIHGAAAGERIAMESV